MTRTHTILIAVLAASAVGVVLAPPAKAEFFGCNTPRVSHYTVSSGSSYRAGSRHAYDNYTPAPRHYYGRSNHYSAYTVRNYRSHY